LAQKCCDPPQQLVEVHPYRAQDGIEPIALNPAEAVALHSMLSFQVPYPRLDRRSPFHPPPHAPIDPPAMALIHMDFDISRVSMAAVAHVHKDLLRVCASNPLNLLQSGLQRVTVIGIAVKGLGPDKPPAAAGGRYTDLASKLVTLVRLAFADALNQRFMNALDFLLYVFRCCAVMCIPLK
jgi:hypothetical protein